MLIFWILLGSALLFVLQYCLYSMSWTRGLSLSLRFEQNTATEGDTINLTERTENRKWLPLPMLSYEYILDRNFAPVNETSARKPIVFRRKVALPGRRASINQSSIKGLPRGYYTVHAAKLSSTDLFYTSKWEMQISCQSRLTVYPGKIPGEKLSLPFRQLLGAVLTRRMAQEDPFQIKGIRPYEIYDSLRTVNWKASAKTGELKVNQFEYSTDEAIVFLLDMGSGSEEAREELLRLASSLSQLFLRRGVSVSFWSNGRNCVSGSAARVPSGSGLGHQAVLDDSLARIKLSASVTAPFKDFLQELPAHVTAKALPVALSADDSGEAVAAFRSVFGPGGGYMISVSGKAESRKEGGVTVLSWDPAAEEVRP